MADQEELARLQQQMEGLLQKQGLLHKEILVLQDDLIRLRRQSSTEEPTVVSTPPPTPVVPPPTPKAVEEPATIPSEKPAAPFDWEQYVGGNLINKIGIAVLLLGLGLFVKYAIDRGLFPPTIRIISGYVAGLALVGTAYYLREKYEAYSAVLFSGGMATLYFTSYIGATFFQPPIIGLYFAFWLMGFLTACTIIVASKYEHQIIGVLGLVGAYAVPFLVNTGSENFALFFSYITFINVGVLVLAARRDWRAMTYTACLLTWFILSFSLTFQYGKLHDSPVTWIFTLVNIVLFYGAILAWHWRRETPLKVGAYIVLILQAIFFYGIILTLTAGTFNGDNLGWATLFCAMPHFLAAYAVQQRFEEKRHYILFAAMGVFFVTISIPIGFEVRGILLLWMVELLALLFAARKLQSKVFEVMTYLLMFTFGVLLLNYWGDAYYSVPPKAFLPLWNLEFLTNTLLMAGMVGLYFLDRKVPLQEKLLPLDTILRCLPAAMGYFIFFHEIYHAFTLKAAEPFGAFGVGDSVLIFRGLWLFIYTFGALVLAAELNIRRWKSAKLDGFIAVAGLMCIALFLGTQLVAMNDLRRIFISDNAQSTAWFILIRYISFGIMGWLYYRIHKALKRMDTLQAYRPQIPLLMHFLVLVILSSELVTVMLLMLGTPDSMLPYREGFSILWGLYSFLLIGLGFKQKSQTLRVAGIVLFGITLVKIFFFDLVNLPILSRTGIFMALGLLLLGASYLYQRFKERI